ncbi:hypothetical protein, partial [Bifidobacterium moraviense]|uniref:hypothetical protein n=1 Tax=Bifidobacterium moraviense TaxID=2675323 RepID=UPI00197B38A1
QAEQDPAVERARLVDKPRGFLHFFNHTPNETARPLHTKIGRACHASEIVPSDAKTDACTAQASEIVPPDTTTDS